MSVFELLKEYIETGRITLDKSIHKELTTVHDPCNYGRKGAKAFGWKDKWIGWGKPYRVSGPRRRAVGVGTGIHICGEEMEGNTSAVVRVYKDGSAKIFCSIGRHGTGAETTQSQIAAEALGIPVDRVQFETGDSDSCPWSRGSIASTTSRLLLSHRVYSRAA